MVSEKEISPGLYPTASILYLSTRLHGAGKYLVEVSAPDTESIATKLVPTNLSILYLLILNPE